MAMDQTGKDLRKKLEGRTVFFQEFWFQGFLLNQSAYLGVLTKLIRLEEVKRDGRGRCSPKTYYYSLDLDCSLPSTQGVHRLGDQLPDSQGRGSRPSASG